MNKSNFSILYKSDMTRYGNSIERYIKRFHYLLRKVQTTKGIVRIVYRVLYKKHREKHGIEISPNTQIGKGLYIGHPYNITINPKARIGNNVNIHKGVLIGQENRGSRMGVPSIGNCVWIGINSAIVGNISIGDNVLIAANSYVNKDIPSNSVVLGNPCIVIQKDNATEDYINNIYQ